MKIGATLGCVLMLTACFASYAQSPIQSLDHIKINDPRVFDLSDDGSGYLLNDGPGTSATIKLIQGPRGTVVGTATIADDHGNLWQDISLTGKLKVSGTGPLSVKLASNAKGQTLRVTGSYDAGLKLMRVKVQTKSKGGPSYQWNDAFVPDNASTTGFSLDRQSATAGPKGSVSGTYAVSVPGTPAWTVPTRETQLRASSYKLQGKGISLYGDYNRLTGTSSIYQAKFSVGYGTIFTPGALVTVSGDESTSSPEVESPSAPDSLLN
jgi:hypothetical protein